MNHLIVAVRWKSKGTSRLSIALQDDCEQESTDNSGTIAVEGNIGTASLRLQLRSNSCARKHLLAKQASRIAEVDRSKRNLIDSLWIDQFKFDLGYSSCWWT